MALCGSSCNFPFFSLSLYLSILFDISKSCKAGGIVKKSRTNRPTPGDIQTETIATIDHDSDLPELFPNFPDFPRNFCGISAPKIWRICPSYSLSIETFSLILKGFNIGQETLSLSLGMTTKLLRYFHMERYLLRLNCCGGDCMDEFA